MGLRSLCAPAFWVPDRESNAEIIHPLADGECPECASDCSVHLAIRVIVPGSSAPVVESTRELPALNPPLTLTNDKYHHVPKGAGGVH